MWVDYKLYMKAESNFHLYLEGKHPPYTFFDFLSQFLGERQDGTPIYGTINYHLRSDGTVHHIIYLSKRANEIVKLLAGSYPHAVMKILELRIKNGNGIKERDQQSKDDL